jgi:prolycopene isomerase
MNKQATQSKYDVVVIGAGMGGLTAGALLAKEGKRVLVVEQETFPGGYIREIAEGPYKINPAIHSIMGCSSAGPFGHGVITEVLTHLEVEDRCQFIAIDPIYRAQFPDFQLDVPSGREAYLEAHTRHFPNEADGLRDLVDLSSEIYREFMRFPSVLRWQDWLMMPFRSPKMFRNATSTLKAAIDRYLTDQDLKSVYAILYPYLALPPSRVSFLLWAVMMASFVEEGAFYCVGGFQGLAGALAEGLTKHGGELVLETRVSEIRADGGRVQGIDLENGQEIAAPVVISNIDAWTTFGDLLETGQVPASYLRKLKEMEPSASLLGLSLATDLDVHALGIPKVTMFSSWDLEEADAVTGKEHVERGGVHIPTVVDASLAPPGEHLVVVQAFVRNETVDLSPAAKAQFAHNLLDQAEKVLPDLRDHITFVADTSAEDGQEFPLHRLGPCYGWANSVGQTGPRRLPYKTPLSGLYLTGHWTQPGSGVLTVVLSGVNAARYVLGKNMSEAVWPLNF